ncbi:hypothetical protein O181_117012 [Austropuccinia psidii MF-1]|uniref:Integrase zinc-binding domain-containing protein n=1 Tax=Austropuccinia psidii MF-1 TaxID=1389203 RepID=A0A9Q3PZ01_9BASI|nr:hypothetical protein [Austropuccinia psidii MF-1]
MLRWEIAIQEYIANITIIYKEGKSPTNIDGLCRWLLENDKSNAAYVPELYAKVPIHSIETDGKNKSRFFEWAPIGGNPDTEHNESEEAETPILGICSSELHNKFFDSVITSYTKHKQCSILFQLLQQKYRILELESPLEGPWLRDYKHNRYLLIGGLLYHRERQTSALKLIDRDLVSQILQECHDCPYMRHMSEDGTKERVASTTWWPKWEQELSEYIKICERFQKDNRKNGKNYGLLQHYKV